MENVSVKDDVLEVSVTRFITIDDIIDNIERYVDRNKTLISSPLLLIDGTRCRSNVSLSDLAKLKDCNKLLVDTFKLFKVAIILDDPVYTATCMIYNNLINSSHYHVKVFSTQGAAHRWLTF